MVGEAVFARRRCGHSPTNSCGGALCTTTSDTRPTMGGRIARSDPRVTFGTAIRWLGKRFPLQLSSSGRPTELCRGVTSDAIGTEGFSMAIRWERLAGDTSRFAVRIAFLDDPDGGEAADSEQSISWGGFQIWVRGVNLCAHLEQSERVDHVYWYLLPLLEWFTQNWDPLLHEERLPCRSLEDTGWRALRNDPVPPFAIDESEEDGREAAWQHWWSRHALCAAREGGVFPDIVFRRLRDAIEVSWGPGQVAGAPDHVVFDISQPSSETLSPRVVAEPLYQILQGASEYLTSVAPDSGRIRKLSQAIGRLRRPRNHELHM